MLFYSVKPNSEVNYENPLGEAFIRLTPQLNISRKDVMWCAEWDT